MVLVTKCVESPESSREVPLTAWIYSISRFFEIPSATEVLTTREPGYPPTTELAWLIDGFRSSTCRPVVANQCRRQMDR